MNKYAALALALTAGFALSGATPAGHPDERPTMTEYVQESWLGPKVPDAAWIDTALATVCKGIREGRGAVVIKPDAYSEKNDGILRHAALKGGCA